MDCVIICVSYLFYHVYPSPWVGWYQASWYYQNGFGVLFSIAPRSILSVTSSINNTHRRYWNFMIGQLVFLGGVIYARLRNSRAYNFTEQFIFSPNIDSPLYFKLYTKLTYMLTVVCDNFVKQKLCCMYFEFISCTL